MHTLRNLLGSRRSLSQNGDDLDGLLLKYGVRPRIAIPGEHPLLLPRDSDGLYHSLITGASASGLPQNLVTQGRLALVYEPTFVLPLTDPTAMELRKFGVNASDFRNENPRALCIGTVAETDGGTILYGTARIIAVENGVRMGKTLLLSVEDNWSDNQEGAEENLLSLAQGAKDTVTLGPEPGDNKWRTLLALLGGTNDSTLLPVKWDRRMRLVAGLYSVRLDIRPHPESARAAIIAELKSQPPDGLLVWADWVSHPDSFMQAYIKARPGAYAELLGNSQRTMNFDDHISELQLHLQQLTSTDSSALVGGEKVGWAEAKEGILGLVGPHFTLTTRAIAMLDSNPYPKPDRMLTFLRSLEQLALAYHNAGGALGQRIAAVAIEDYGIEIALFDAALKDKQIFFDGETLNPQPHVKVDDYKTPDSAGRIYFAISHTTMRFVVDHIGLHDYA